MTKWSVDIRLYKPNDVDGDIYVYPTNLKAQDVFRRRRAHPRGLGQRRAPRVRLVPGEAGL